MRKYLIFLAAVLLLPLSVIRAQNFSQIESYKPVLKAYQTHDDHEIIRVMDSVVMVTMKNPGDAMLPFLLFNRGGYLARVDDLAGMVENEKMSFDIGALSSSPRDQQYIISTATTLVEKYTRLKMFEEAYAEIQRMVEYSESYSNHRSLGVSYRLMGDYFLEIGNYTDAHEYYARSIDEFRLSDPSMAVQPWANMLQAYIDANDSRVLDSYQEFLDEFPSAGAEKYAMVTLLGWYVKNGDIDSASKFNALLMDLSDNGRTISSAARAKYDAVMSHYWSQVGDYDKAIEHCSRIEDVRLRLEETRKVELVFGNVEKAALLGNSYLSYIDSVEKRSQGIIDSYYRETLNLEQERSRLTSDSLMIARHRLQVEEENRILASRQKILELQNEAASITRVTDSLTLERIRKNNLLTIDRIHQMDMENNILEGKTHVQNTAMMALLVGVIMLVVLILVVVRLIMFRTTKRDNARRTKALEASRKRREEIEANRDKAHLGLIAVENSRKMKAAVLANMSHDIRTPLNAIVGFNDLLSSSDMEFPDEERDSMVAVMMENSELLLSLLNDIVDKSALERGFSEIDIKATHLDRVCMSSIRMVKPYVADGVSIRMEHDGDPLTIQSDPTNLQRVMINLLTNASKYTRQGSITVAYGVVDGEVELSVADTGPGISPEKAEQIFERHRTADASRMPNSYGLGLSISALIVDALHGRIYLDTEYKEGARFVIRLPLS